MSSKIHRPKAPLSEFLHGLEKLEVLFIVKAAIYDKLIQKCYYSLAIRIPLPAVCHLS